MDTDDIAPPSKKARSYELGQDLSKLSVAELRALIDDLKTEAARVEQTLATKQSSKSAAESVFKRDFRPLTTPLGKPGLALTRP